MKKIITEMFTVVLLLGTQSLIAQPCNCSSNFEWIKKTFEQNDAGFADAIKQKGTAAYTQHNNRFSLNAKNITDKFQCAQLLNEWLKFFRKAHLYAVAMGEPADTNSNAWPQLIVDVKQLQQMAAKQTEPAIEGLWTTGNYNIAIVKTSEGYKGVIVKAPGNTWKTNQVKLEINKDFSGLYFMGDRSPTKFDKARLIGNNTLQLGNVYLTREQSKFRDDDTTALYIKSMQASLPFLQQLSASTLLFRIPSFNESQKFWIDSLLLANKSLLEKTPNLIIDIRNNGGGSDISYDKIIPYIYTNPIRTVAMEFYSTPLNNSRMESYLSIPNLPEQDKKEINEALQMLASNLGKMVNLNAKTVDIQTLDTVLPNPANIAILINENNGSTAEQFLLAAKQSHKVKLYGTTTMGVLDISNMHSVESPDKNIQLGYCLSRSLRIPAMPVDNIGIQPDYFIDSSIPAQRWLTHVQQIIETQ